MSRVGKPPFQFNGVENCDDMIANLFLRSGPAVSTFNAVGLFIS